jgi:hypothetical protein
MLSCINVISASNSRTFSTVLNFSRPAEPIQLAASSKKSADGSDAQNNPPSRIKLWLYEVTAHAVSWFLRLVPKFGSYNSNNDPDTRSRLKKAKSAEDLKLKYDPSSKSGQTKLEKKIESILLEWIKFQNQYIAKHFYSKYVKSNQSWHDCLNLSFQAKVRAFAANLSRRSFGTELKGVGTNAAVFSFRQDGKDFVIKLPLVANILDGDNQGRNQNLLAEEENLQKAHALKGGISDHFQSMPDYKGFDGLCLVSNLMEGTPVRGEYGHRRNTRMEFMASLNLNPDQVPTLLKDYMKMYASGEVVLWDLGGTNNTFVTDDGDLKIFDFDPYYDGALEKQNELFQDHPLAGTLYHMLTRDLMYFKENRLTNQIRSRVEATKANHQRDYVSYRLDLLKRGLSQLLIEEVINQDELRKEINYLLDANKNKRKLFSGSYIADAGVHSLKDLLSLCA